MDRVTTIMSVAMGPFKISVLIVVAWLATTLILYYSKRN